MVKLPPFDVEQWMDKYETTPGVLNIAETCCASVSVDDLRKFNRKPNSPSPLDLGRKMTYSPIRGSDELRQNIANLYHMEGLGAEVSLWELKAEDEFLPDVNKLIGLVKGNTKMLVINNPYNPTGATIPIEMLEQIVEVPRKHDIILFADEVFRPLFHSVESDKIPPSVLSLNYERAVVTSPMSKAWALAGIRVGWIASNDSSIMGKVAIARDYTTIGVSQLDDQIARYALSEDVRPQLIDRNITLARKNLEILDLFVHNHSDFVSWVKPTAGTTAFMRFKKNGQPVEDEKFCIDVLHDTKVMFLPGCKCFGHGKRFEGYVRVGYVQETEGLRRALEQLGAYVKENLA
ncbi:hypothetical protein TruAng_009918 [Truncatella angustata]|nr:hypothetical protein TruAng_009918 [Truncatella angustata]